MRACSLIDNPARGPTLSSMFKTWRLGRILGFPVEVSASFLLLLGVVLLWLGGPWGLIAVTLTFSSVLLHELGHAVVARQRGVPVSAIGLHFFGGAAQMAGAPRSAKDEIAIAAAGPAVSLVLAGLGFGAGALLQSPFVALVGWINLVLAIFNLIPALPMDGGRILRALLTRRLDYVRATDVAVTVARVFTVAFAVLGLAIGNLQLVILSPLLWIMSSRERMIARMTGPRYGGGGGGGGRRARGGEVVRPSVWRDRDDDDDDPGGNRPRFVIRSVGGRWIIER
jgi:Zn-dependent protease